MVIKNNYGVRQSLNDFNKHKFDIILYTINIELKFLEVKLY